MSILLHAYICFLGFAIVSSILNMGKQCPVTVVSLQRVFPACSRDIPRDRFHIHCIHDQDKGIPKEI